MKASLKLVALVGFSLLSLSVMLILTGSIKTNRFDAHPNANSTFLIGTSSSKQSHVNSSIGSKPSTANDDSDFKEAIFYGVESIQIEEAMAHRRIPPLRPVLYDPETAPLRPMKRILVVSTWRTGSSFLGELINSSPGVFYSYEPLNFPSDSRSPMDLIRSLFQCNFPVDYVESLNAKPDFLMRNRRLWESCHQNKNNYNQTLCIRPGFLRTLCAHSPVQLIKVVRLRIQDLKPEDDWKIIYLARDPRGVAASRTNLTWCQEDAACGDIRRLCSEMEEDVNALSSRYLMIRFEDLTLNMERETERLFKYLEMPLTPSVRLFLETHTKGQRHQKSDINKDSDPFSTHRDSKSVAYEWRKKLSKERIRHISETCSSVLKRLDYPMD